MNVFVARTAELAEARPELAAAVEPLLKAREAVGRQIADLDRKVMRLARNDAQVSLHVRSLSPRGHGRAISLRWNSNNSKLRTLEINRFKTEVVPN